MKESEAATAKKQHRKARNKMLILDCDHIDPPNSWGWGAKPFLMSLFKSFLNKPSPPFQPRRFVTPLNLVGIVGRPLPADLLPFVPLRKRVVYLLGSAVLGTHGRNSRRVDWADGRWNNRALVTFQAIS